MKAYIIAITSGGYMAPVAGGKLYKSKARAFKACQEYNNSLKGVNAVTARVLVANNWHEEG